MTDTVSTTTKPNWRYGPKPRRRVKAIKLPNGDTLVPRKALADEVGESDKSTKRRNLATTYIAGIAYLPHDASLSAIAATARPRNQPATRPTLRKRNKG
jgi:hypothetical protein